jgi:predicted SprT family Zn-dependent metalloprotease
MCKSLTLSQKKLKMASLFNQLKKQFKLPQRWEFRWTRAATQMGVCRIKPRKGEYIIGISVKFLEKCSWETMEDTLRHEFAHALDYEKRGTTDHSYHWKKWCEVTGADPSRTEEISKEQAPQLKYLAMCKDCGVRKQVGRRSKHYNGNWVCGTCHLIGKISPLYLVPNPKY